MRVIGTAGHVDHGKSTLVEALTGTHPDRLREEREREMTIVLGFAWLTLDDGEEVGIVDVPGHRDFIENMLSGVGGIDAAMFVIAADEGVMPQTREHLAILDLLQVSGGVVALTKKDLVEDPEWLELVEEEVRTLLAGTILEDAPIVPVSAKSGEGLNDLRLALADCLKRSPRRLDLNRPRLPIDRTFTIPGFGTVATGTLMDGQFSVGDDVVIMPAGTRGRIRGLQTHMQKEQAAVPGSRTAVNISGVSLEEVERGSWVARPGDYRPTRRVDLRFRLLKDASQPVNHDLEVKFFVGAAQVIGRVRLLGVKSLRPGEEGWVQLELRDPVIAARGDRYILRRPSPGETLGGGIVVDPYPKGRHKRFSKRVIAGLEALEQGSPADVLSQALEQMKAGVFRSIAAAAALEDEQVETAVNELLESGVMVVLSEGPFSEQRLVMHQSYWREKTAEVSRSLADYHKKHPLRRGVPKEELKSKLRMEANVFSAFVEKMLRGELLEGEGAVVWSTGHVIRFNKLQEGVVDRLMAKFAASPYSPPTMKDAEVDAGPAIVSALIEMGELVQVSAGVLFQTTAYENLVAGTKQHIQNQGGIKVADFRDKYQTSRKYALAFLEHLDAIGVTIRDGDYRRLK